MKFEQAGQLSVYEALNGKMIKQCSLEELAATVSESIENAWFDLGLRQAADGGNKDKDLLKIKIIAEINACFSTLTLAEVKLAIRNGARGHYGETFGLTVIGVAQWLAAYMTHQSRAEAKLQKKRLAEPPPQPPTEAQLQQLKRQNIINAFASYRQSGQYFDVANRVYNNLDQLGLIPFTAAQKREFVQQAIRQAKEQANPLRGRNSQERAAFRKASRQLLELEQTGAINHHNAIIADAKRLALNAFFEQLAGRGEELLID